MVDGVQLMLDTVDATMAQLFQPELIGERFLDMSWLDDRLGGTADVTEVEPFGWAHLLDYKNGYEVVEVEDNAQFQNYAVGILHEHPDAEGVHCTVVQPNAPHEEGTVRTVSYTREEIEKFQVELKEAADATSKPNAPLRAGDWCKWCLGKNKCPEFEKVMQEEAGVDFANDPPEEIAHPVVSNAEHKAALKSGADLEVVYREGLAKRAKWIPVIDKWAREIEGEIQNALMDGKEVPGFKLVNGKSNRKWVELPEVVAEQIQTVLPDADCYAPAKILSPAKMEKLGDKATRKTLKELVATLAIKPPGKLTVARDNDPRPAADVSADAIADFADDPAEDE